MTSSIQQIVGKIFQSVVMNDDKDRIEFVVSDNEKYTMYHSQNCCEHVSVEDVVGDIQDLVDTPILQAEEVTHSGTRSMEDWPDSVLKSDYSPESYTWTFYKLATIKGSVTIRWYGTSNGYYSESVYFSKDGVE